VLKFSQLTRIQRMTLILFVIVVTNWVMVSTTGYSILGGDLFTVFFIVFLILLTLTLIRPLTRKIVWRVRNRLLVTFFLVGVLPVVLMGAVVCLGFYLLVGATAGYLSQSQVNSRLDQLDERARQLSEDIVNGRRVSAESLPEHAIIRFANRTIAKRGPLRDIPDWAAPGFKGVIKSPDQTYFMAAHAKAGSGPRQVEAFMYSPLDDEVLGRMLPGVAGIRIYRLRVDRTVDESGKVVGIEVDRDEDLRPVLDSTKVVQPPKSRGFWDITPFSGWSLPVRELDGGGPDDHFVNAVTRPSALVTHLLTPLGSYARAPLILFFSVAIAFLCVELIAFISSAQLTRSITRTVHDLYVGTKNIERGDFSQRIPIRTKDQLSELGTSFNSMTQQIERLIVEVKEKEKLEAELEIARLVQVQLFPKEVPKLRTLELKGHCDPARVVSGDYYDFIPVNSQSTALVIGDISGKGISAALLMASVQSSLHAQLALQAGGPISTATLVGRLNRQLYESTPPEKYATFYCGVYDDDRGQLLYTNAGHLPPILLRRGEIKRLDVNGTVVGLFPDFVYEQTVVQLQPGDLLMAFTDGITESEDRTGDQFGDRRLGDLLIRNSEKPLDEIVQIVTASVREWTQDLDNQDDTTMLLARRM
jgi:sigma-B regulation protein RsbU (phosphoserine phosphatase)